MNGKVTTSYLLLLLGASAHAAESSLRGVSRSLQFGFAGEELNPFAKFQADTTTTTTTTTTSTLPFQFLPTGVVDTTTFPKIPVLPFQLDTTKQFQFGSPNLDDFTTTFPSIPGVSFPLDKTNQFQFGSPDLDVESINYVNLLAGLGFDSPGIGGGGGSCPQVPDGTPCTANYLPLSCGDGGCVYDNSCLAGAAGFSESQCELVP
jgi:hypothetical protein